MSIDFIEIGPPDLWEYSKISIAFSTDSFLEVILPEKCLGGIELQEKKLEKTVYIDQDQIPGVQPVTWEDEFDLKSWSFWLARADGNPVGGVTILPL